MHGISLLSFIALTVLFSSPVFAQDMEKDINKIAAESHGRTGIGLLILETNKSAWLNAKEHFPMQSVYKLPIGMAVLSLVDSGVITPDEMVTVGKDELIGSRQHSPIRDAHPEGNFQISVRDLLYYSVSESDGTASDVLLRLVGGADKVMSFLSRIGVSGIRVANTEMEIGSDDKIQYQNWATPEGAVEFLKALISGKWLKPESQAFLLKLCTETETGMNRIKGLLPKGTVVAHKTGSSRTVNGITAATNDIGVVTLPNGNHMIVVVFVSDSPAEDMVRESIIAKIARLGWDTWGK